MTTVHVGSTVPFVLVAVGALASCAARADMTTRRLPDRVVLAAAVAVATAAVVTADVGPLAGGILSATPVLLVHLLDPTAIGFGDVKLAAVLGGAVGLLDWRMALLVPASAAAIATFQAGLARSTCVALGPALLIGYGLAVVLAALGNGA